MLFHDEVKSSHHGAIDTNCGTLKAGEAQDARMPGDATVIIASKLR